MAGLRSKSEGPARSRTLGNAMRKMIKTSAREQVDKNIRSASIHGTPDDEVGSGQGRTRNRLFAARSETTATLGKKTGGHTADRVTQQKIFIDSRRPPMRQQTQNDSIVGSLRDTQPKWNGMAGIQNQTIRATRSNKSLCRGHPPGPKILANSSSNSGLGHSHNSSSKWVGEDFPDVDTKIRKGPSIDTPYQGVVLQRTSKRSPAAARTPQRKQPNKLGAHYERCGIDLPEFDGNEARQNHDQALAATLDGQKVISSGDGTCKLANTAKPAAFTDRSLRLREGRGVKSLIVGDGSPTQYELEESLPPQNSSEWASSPCGSPSHTIHDVSGTHRFFRDVSPLSGMKSVGHAFNSEKMSETLRISNSRSPSPTAHRDEVDFSRSLGRRIKTRSPHPGRTGVALMHRSMSPDDNVPAGAFSEEFRPEIEGSTHKRRQAWQGTAKSPAPRTGAALIVAPRNEDEPPSPKINTRTRGGGHCKAGFSPEAEGHVRRQNPEIFRFQPDSRRARSPSPLMPDDHAGVSSIMAVDKVFRENLCTPQSPRRLIVGNSSDGMNTLMNQSLCQQLANDETAERFKSDPVFSKACQATLNQFNTQNTLLNTIRSEVGVGVSSGVAQQLYWDD